MLLAIPTYLFFLRYTASDLVPSPLRGLGGSSNYFFGHDGEYIQQLSVVMSLDEDLIVEENFGWSLQVNTYSSQLDLTTWVWQQFSVRLSTDGISLFFTICEWQMTTSNPMIPELELIVDYYDYFAELDEPLTIPANSQLTILVASDDADGPVTVGSYTVTVGGSTFSDSVRLGSLTNRDGTATTWDQFAPNLRFMVNMVGYGDCEGTSFTSGSGTIMYSSSTNSFVPLQEIPSETWGLPFVWPCESSNMDYGQLSNVEDTSFIQAFQIA